MNRLWALVALLALAVLVEAIRSALAQEEAADRVRQMIRQRERARAADAALLHQIEATANARRSA